MLVWIQKLIVAEAESQRSLLWLGLKMSRFSRKILSGDGGIASMASVAAGSALGDEIC
jgi:hypothetical protein